MNIIDSHTVPQNNRGEDPLMPHISEYEVESRFIERLELFELHGWVCVVHRYRTFR